MDVTTLLITVYCAIDEWLAGVRLREQGTWLLAPPSRSAKGPVPRLPGWVTPARRRVETVIGNWSSATTPNASGPATPGHLWSRWQRKLLSHTLAVWLCQQYGLDSLRFAHLLTT